MAGTLNFFRPHMSLKDRTPAQAAGVKFPFRNWKEIIQQPYDVTARIPITGFVSKSPTKKIKRKKSRRVSHVSDTPTTLGGIR